MLLGGFLSLVFLVWMAAKIGKQSVPMAVGAFLFWPVLIYAVIKYWGDEESDIKLPFALFVLSAGYAWYSLYKLASPLPEDDEALLGLARLFA
jgi:hypothetical protein